MSTVMQRSAIVQLAWIGFLVVEIWCLLPAAELMGQEAPLVKDPRLELTLFAEDPDIVTPIGLVIDGEDRIFVVESHTHHPAKDYRGPKGDRIKIFRDTDADGRSDGFTVFAEDLQAAMNLALSPEGALYVVCAREVWRLHDRDGDGVSEARDRVLRLRTSNSYAHSALLGITFGPEGWLYISRGNNGSAAYTFEGSDGSSVSGYGDGGSVVRCLPDGSKVEEFATGFWNPFDIKFDHAGRLLGVDNDPDARGPNRFVHIVRHGDYGYKSMYGGGGNHPFQGWDGTLPGTLPMIDGTGEAPSGLLDAARAALPKDYAGNYLVTIWNENTINRYVTRPLGMSLVATNSVLVAGDRDFRPVAIDADTKGNIYFTDWVLVDYPNHGRGRLWRLSSRSGTDAATSRARSAKPEGNEVLLVMRELMEPPSEAKVEAWIDALAGADPFQRHAAVVGLSRRAHPDRWEELLRHENPLVRRGALLAWRRADREPPMAALRRAMSDPDPEVCRTALLWIGESMLADLRPALDGVLDRPDFNGVLFETWLAAVQNLDPAFVSAYRSRARDKANQLRRAVPEGLIEGLVSDTTKPARVRALAMSRLSRGHEPAHGELLVRLAQTGDSTLRREAIRSLGQAGALESGAALREIALDVDAPAEVRAEALVALSWLHEVPVADFLPLLQDKSRSVRVETIRLLRREAWQNPVRQVLLDKLDAWRKESAPRELVEHLEFALYPPGTENAPRQVPRPATLESWGEALKAEGRPEAGARVFFSPLTACSRCHQMHNRGGRLGPDLSNLGQSVSRPQIIHSILRPSDDFPPQYQAWYVVTKDGEVHQGLQLDHKAAGAIELQTTDGATRHFDGDEIESYGVLQNSLMPDALENTMTVSEFRDLVAFLAASSD